MHGDVRALLLAGALCGCAATATETKNEDGDGSVDSGPLEWKELEASRGGVTALTTHGDLWVVVPVGWDLGWQPNFGDPFDFAVADAAWTVRYGCALDTSGALYCWGQSLDAEPWPYDAPLEGPYSVIESGSERVCMIRRDSGAVECLGDTNLQNPWEIREVDPGPAIELAVSKDGYCILLEDGTARCGQDDTARYEESYEEVPAGSFDHIVPAQADGQPSVCAWTEAGAVACWGLATGAGEWIETSIGTDIAGITPRGNDICAWSAGGEFVCVDENGVLSERSGRAPPTLSGVRRAVSGGGHQLCVEWVDSSVVSCWDQYGELLDLELSLDGEYGADGTFIYPVADGFGD